MCVDLLRGFSGTVEAARARASAPNFNFNVSHEGDYVVLAAEPVLLVGVDVSAPFESSARDVDVGLSREIKTRRAKHTSEGEQRARRGGRARSRRTGKRSATETQAAQWRAIRRDTREDARSFFRVYPNLCESSPRARVASSRRREKHLFFDSKKPRLLKNVGRDRPSCGASSARASATTSGTPPARARSE